MTNHPRSHGGILLNVKRLPQCTDSAAHGISSKKATEIRRNGEAFMRMMYASDDNKIVEWLWNSRDGVTPFCIGAIDDESINLRHVNWNGDQYLPDFIPPVGSRIFVDATPELMLPEAVKYVEKYWDEGEYAMSKHPAFEGMDKAAAAQHFVDEWTKPGSPHVITVGPNFRGSTKNDAASRGVERARAGENRLERPGVGVSEETDTV
jgi:hypothetical protein